MAVNKFKMLEESSEQPIRDLLINLYKKYGNQQKVADELGITQGTLSLWLAKNDLVLRTFAVPKDAEIVIQEAAL